jgi:5-methylcytosine-specific restriction endonuclease McrA
VTTPPDPRYNTTAWRKVRLLVLDRDRGLCQMHGRKCTRYATQVDHVVAIEDGGAFYDVANLRAACRTCNAGAGSTVRERKRYRDSVARYLPRF